VERSGYSTFHLSSAVDGQPPPAAVARGVRRYRRPKRISYGPTDAAAEREVLHPHQQGRPERGRERRRWAREFTRSAFSAEPEESAEGLLAELLRSGAVQWRDGRLLAQVPQHEPGDEGSLRAPWPRHWPDIATAPADK